MAKNRGTIMVPISDTRFGPVLLHGLTGRCIWMVLPRQAGWMANGWLCLAHQTYLQKLQNILDGHPDGLREVAVVDVDAGEWVTVWEKGGGEE